MPLYAFACDDCGATSEQVFKIADCPDEMPCACGALLRKRFGPNPFCNIVQTQVYKANAQGRVSQDQMDKLRGQLAKRAADHDASSAGKEARVAQWERMNKRSPDTFLPRSWYESPAGKGR